MEEKICSMCSTRFYENNNNNIILDIPVNRAIREWWSLNRMPSSICHIG